MDSTPLAPAGQSITTPRRAGPLNRDWVPILAFLLSVLAGFALLWVAWQVLSPILHILVLFGVAGVLAFALGRAVTLLEARFHNRLAATGLVYVVALVVTAAGLWLLAGPFARQAAALVHDLPTYVDTAQQRLPEVQGMLGRYGIETNIDTLRQQATSAVAQSGTGLLRDLLGMLAQLGGVVFDLLLLLVVSFYLVLDGPTLRRRIMALVPPGQQSRIAFFETNAARILGSYLRGQLTLALIIGVATGVGAGLLGLPYAVVLGVLAGLFELIPMFGPILSAVPALLVALFQPFPTVVWVLIMFLVIQQVENNVLAPRISGHAVGLHPLGALFALLVGLQLAGLLGGLFAVPLAGLIWVLIQAAYRNTVAPEETPTTRRWSLPPLRLRHPRAGGPPTRVA